MRDNYTPTPLAGELISTFECSSAESQSPGDMGLCESVSTILDLDTDLKPHTKSKMAFEAAQMAAAGFRAV